MRCSLVSVLGLATLACAPKTAPVAVGEPEAAPPIAPTREHVHTEHEVERSDPWYWLRERENPEVIAYLEAENNWTERQTAHLADARKMLFDEMLGRIKEDDTSVPVRDGDYFYYSRTEEGKSYDILCRKKGSLEAAEEVVLDENVLAEGLEYFSLGRFEMSPDHSLLAYSTDTSGREVYTLQILDTASGELLEDTLEGVSWSVAWAADGKALFYSTQDDSLRPYQIWKHQLGTPQSEDELVYQEDDEKFRVWITTTRSEEWLVLGSASSMSNEFQVLPADSPDGEWQMLFPREPNREGFFDHQGDRFLLGTNDAGESVNFRLMSAPEEDPSAWTEVVAHREDVYLTDVNAFEDFLVLSERENGTTQLRIVPNEGEAYVLDMPEEVYTVRLGENYVFDTDTLRFNYTSMITPNSTYETNLETQERTLLKQTEVLGGYDSSAYDTRRVMATAEDGTEIPITLVWKKELRADGPQPLRLTAYGSYGSSSDPRFGSTNLTWLDRGLVMAVAHIRGGGEMGRAWYEDGKFLNKKNTFTDFIAASEHLIDEGWTSPDQLAIAGGSAGGLLMGAVVNMRPELYRVVEAHVPFVDVVTTMLDASIPLTTNEWEEWGDPRDKTYFDYMLSYSPYDNVTAQDYPHMLITAGLNDPRVQYWEPAKWTAKLRATGTGDKTLLMKTHMGAGHGGASGLHGYLEDKAFDVTFVLDKLGMTIEPLGTEAPSTEAAPAEE